MPRGQLANVGDVMVNKNGYHHTRTEDGWRLTHHLVAEEKILGRMLRPGEQVRFKDGDRTNLHPENLEVIFTKTSSIRRRLARIESQLQDLQAEKEDLEEQLRVSEKQTTE